MSTLNPRTLEYYRDLGYLCTTVESYNAHIQRSKDMFGIFDQIAIGFGPEVIGIQTTSWSNVQARVAKILASPIYEKWLDRGARVHVIGWAKGNPHPKIIRMTRESHPPTADPVCVLYVPENNDH